MCVDAVSHSTAAASLHRLHGPNRLHWAKIGRSLGWVAAADDADSEQPAQSFKVSPHGCDVTPQYGSAAVVHVCANQRYVWCFRLPCFWNKLINNNINKNVSKHIIVSYYYTLYTVTQMDSQIMIHFYDVFWMCQNIGNFIWNND